MAPSDLPLVLAAHTGRRDPPKKKTTGLTCVQHILRITSLTHHIFKCMYPIYICLADTERCHCHPKFNARIRHKQATCRRIQNCYRHRATLGISPAQLSRLLQRPCYCITSISTIIAYTLHRHRIRKALSIASASHVFHLRIISSDFCDT